VFVAHLTKGSNADPVYRVQGSIGLVGGARSLLAFARDPDDEEDGDRRVLGHAKCNWGKLARTLVYRIESAQVQAGEATIETSRLLELGESELSGRAVLGASDDDTPTGKQQQVLELFADYLDEDEPRRASLVVDAAKARGISRATVYRTAEKEGVVMEQIGFPATAYWRLPTEAERQLSHDDETTGVSDPMRQLETRGAEPNPSLLDLQVSHTRERETTGLRLIDLLHSEDVVVEWIRTAFDATEETA
jgi:hypothetical protein